MNFSISSGAHRARQDAAAVVSRAQLPELLSELNVTLASPEVMLEVDGWTTGWCFEYYT